MIYAATPEEIETRRKAFIRKWRLRHRPRRRPGGSRRPPLTSPACRRTNGEAREQRTRSNVCMRTSSDAIKIQIVLPSADTAAMLFWALLASVAALRIWLRSIESTA